MRKEKYWTSHCTRNIHYKQGRIFMEDHISMFISKTHLIQNTFVSLHRKPVKLSLTAKKRKRK